jgi:hypothetical protein
MQEFGILIILCYVMDGMFEATIIQTLHRNVALKDPGLLFPVWGRLFPLLTFVLADLCLHHNLVPPGFPCDSLAI